MNRQAEKKRIDLNCDLGEHPGTDLDEQIMPYISSCNIASGFHAGDPATIQKTIALAMHHNVAIGAHPSFPDREGFGRREMDMSAADLTANVRYQVAAIKGMAEAMGGKLHHVKVHGALYNLAARDEETAGAVIGGIASIAWGAIVYGPPNSWLEAGAQLFGLPYRVEAFADRVYEEDLSLRSRFQPGSVLTEPDKVLSQVRQLALRERITTYSGEVKILRPQTICLHSDTTGAVALARQINQTLNENGLVIAPA